MCLSNWISFLALKKKDRLLRNKGELPTRTYWNINNGIIATPVCISHDSTVPSPHVKAYVCIYKYKQYYLRKF